MTFAPAYLTLPTAHEVTTGDGKCVCGNYFMNDSSAAGADGRLSNQMLAPEPRLSSDAGYSVCNDCGRVYFNDDLESGEPTAVVARYDPDSPDHLAARLIYVQHNL